MVRWEPGRAGERRQREDPGDPQAEGQKPGVRAGSYRVGDAPQEHAHQRVGGPEHLHFLLHEMLLLGFGGEAESRTGASSCRGCGGGRDGGGRHSLPRTRASGSGSWPQLQSPTRKRCSPAQPSRDRRPALRRANGAGRGRPGWLRPLACASVTWSRLRSRGCGVGAVQGRASVASGSVQFPEKELCPETNAEALKPVSLPSPGWLLTCYPPPW